MKKKNNNDQTINDVLIQISRKILSSTVSVGYLWLPQDKTVDGEQINKFMKVTPDSLMINHLKVMRNAFFFLVERFLEAI